MIEVMAMEAENKEKGIFEKSEPDDRSQTGNLSQITIAHDLDQLSRTH